MYLIYNSIFLLLFSSILIGNPYPHWFLFPTNYASNVIGYTTGNSTSINDAADMFCFYKETIIKGELYRYNDYDEKISDYYWYFPPQCVENIISHLSLVSSFASNVIIDSKIELYVYPPIMEVLSNEIHNESKLKQFSILDIIEYRDELNRPNFNFSQYNKYVEIDRNTSPDWIKKEFWQLNNYYYSVVKFPRIDVSSEVETEQRVNDYN